ncbi:alpha-1,2-fucosyltransferase [Ruminococcus sp. 5_1_39BFAA]|uniref:alpha-1,2-fucosyltransferase n=1 Tax=Ruminococcus sp. 5_1_39BFAA TaxID=457412 RepID=UPI0035612E1B
MNWQEFIYKAGNVLRKKLIISNYNNIDYEKYCKKYMSYHHMLRHTRSSSKGLEQCYLSARPNPGAGIGHQMANWIAGYWFAEQFGLKFAHIPFSSVKNPFVPNNWDTFLGFGTNEVKVKDLLNSGWKRVVLPLFDEKDKAQVERIGDIIASYQGEKVVFLLEQDQFYFNQYDISDVLQNKFYSVHQRNNEELVYRADEYNIAVHIRRGDIVLKPGEENPNLKMRWMDNAYFVNALKYTLSEINSEKPIHIYLFSQGKREDYPEFNEFDNVTFCVDMGAQESFLHMVFADALITSKSSFSYKPALLNRGLKVCPENFWHGYPKDSQWHLLNDEGYLDA